MFNFRLQGFMRDFAANCAQLRGALEVPWIADVTAALALKANLSDLQSLQTTVASKAATSALSAETTRAQTAEVALQTTATNNAQKLATLPYGLSKGSATIPNIALLATQDVTITFNKAMPDSNYDLSYDIFGQGLGNMKLVVKSQTATGVVLTVTAIAAITGGGTIKVTATDLYY